MRTPPNFATMRPTVPPPESLPHEPSMTSPTRALTLALFATLLLAAPACSSSPAENDTDTPELDATGPDVTEDPEDGDTSDPISDETPLILIGFDGFRPDYLSLAPTPNFDRLIARGVVAESLEPVFPTKTFVNLYSIVTGLYAENHGIVGNTVRDPATGDRLRMSDAELQGQSRWWGGEPIWVTAEKQGKRAGTYFWVGSEAEIGGERPTHWMPFATNYMNPARERIDQVVAWLSADDPVDFATLYFSDLDGVGHSQGPRGSRLFSELQEADANLGYLIDELEAAGLWPNVNILIVSDHGMTALDDDKVIRLDHIIDERDVFVVEWSPVASLIPDAGKADEVYQALKAAEENYTVYRKEDVPERLRYSNHERIPKILVVADPPYTIANQYILDNIGVSAGGHGYDPEFEDMHGFFAAIGPDFKQGLQSETLKIVDLYALMAHLLALEPADHDGDLVRISHILAN
ncbi:alkaline phosphatase family protein [Bradymonadales bacterium TMQ1]|nr:alkaline phosphatase family protein [Bradymonadales bacterium TMQ1]